MKKHTLPYLIFELPGFWATNTCLQPDL